MLTFYSYDTYAVTPKIGSNLLEIEVVSDPGPSDPYSSPAGLAFTVTIASG